MASLQTQVSNLSDWVDVACNHHCSQHSASEAASEETQAVQQNNVHVSQSQSPGDCEVQAAVYKAFKDISRRRQNVFVHGLPESDTITDCDAFLQLCESQLAAKPHIGINDCVRRGKAEPDKPRRVLVRLRS